MIHLVYIFVRKSKSDRFCGAPLGYFDDVVKLLVISSLSGIGIALLPGFGPTQSNRLLPSIIVVL